MFYGRRVCLFVYLFVYLFVCLFGGVGGQMLGIIVSLVFSELGMFFFFTDDCIIYPIPLICLTEDVGSFVGVCDISFTLISRLAAQHGAVYNKLKILQEFPQVYRLKKIFLFTLRVTYMRGPGTNSNSLQSQSCMLVVALVL